MLDLLAADHFSDAAVLLQICTAILYISFISLLCKHPIRHWKPGYKVSPEAGGSRATSNEPSLWVLGGIVILTGVLASLFRSTYPPIMTFLALLATYYAIEHFGSLGTSREQQVDLLKRMKEANEKQEGLISSGAATKQGLDEALNRLDEARREIHNLENRLGTEHWAEQFNAYMVAPVPLTCVYSVWDDTPRLDTASESGWGSQHDQSYTEFVRRSRVLGKGEIVESEISLYNRLKEKYTALPDAKTTFVARAPLESTNFLCAAGANDEINAISAILACHQIRLVNNDQFHYSRLFAAQKTKIPSWNNASEHDLFKGIEISIDELKNSGCSERLTQTLLWWLGVEGQDGQPTPELGDSKLILRGNRNHVCLILQCPKGSETCLASTRAYQVLAFMSLTVPLFTLLGGPKAPIASEMCPPRRKENEPLADRGALESAYAVALVQSDASIRAQGGRMDGNSSPLPALDEDGRIISPKAQQDANRDYAFDLLASGTNAPFLRRRKGFDAATPEEFAARNSLRAYDRLLRSELRYSVPLETYLLGRLLFKASKHVSVKQDISEFTFGDCFDTLAETSALCNGHRNCLSSALREFLVLEVEVGNRMNGNRPLGGAESNRVADLIWRMM